jgi:glycosyltransferase involved in cell wall biosynthesis
VRVGIDARLYLADRTGIGSYTAHLLQTFARVAADDEFVLFTDSAVACPEQNFRNVPIHVRKRILWTLLFLPLRLGREKLDLFHGTANFELPLLAPCPLVATVHDLIPLYFPELVSRKFYLLFRGLIGRTVRRAARVITDSDFSRADILKRFDVPPEKVVTIPLAPHPRFTPEDDGRGGEVRKKYGLARRYFLFVGVFEPRKNIPFLVDAFETFRQEGGDPEVQLVLAGGPGFRGREITDEVRRRNLEPTVRQVGYVPDDDLPALYREAELCIVPSRYEGFGLPVLEAMACGTAVLAADSSSLPEIVGDAGELFPLGSRDALVEKLVTLSASREALLQAGRDAVSWAGRFTWEETARRTLNVYRNVVGESAR